MKICLPLKISIATITTFLCSLLFFLYLQINFWRCFGLWDTLQVDIFRILLAIGCFGLAFKEGWKLEIPKKCINYLVIIVGCGLLIQLVNWRNAIGVTLSAIITVLWAFVFATKRIYLVFLYLHIFVLSLVIGYKFYIGEDPNLMFQGTSRNHISILFMMAAAVINIEEFKNNKNITLWPSILFLVFSVAAAGRGGVICALLYMLSISIYKINGLKRKQRIRVVGIILCSGILIFVFYAPVIFEYIVNLEIFMRMSGQRISGNGRELMNVAYLKNINFLTFFYGYEFSANPIFQIEGNLNPHNSFITLHRLYGFTGIIFLGILVDAMIRLWKNHMKPYAFILLVILMRGASEQFLFPGEYDFIIVSVLLFSRLYLYGERDVKA